MKQKKRMSMATKNKLVGLAFVSPWILCAIFLLLFPIYRSMVMSFADVSNMAKFEYTLVGFDNYKRIFLEDITFMPMFMNVLKNTLINTPLICIFSIYIATLLNQKIKFRGLFRTIFFLPVILGTGFVMKQLLDANVQGEAVSVVINTLLPREVVNYLGSSVSGMVLEFLNRITTILWRSGVQIIIFLTGLQSIQPQVYEAAKIDSASEWETFWLITFPMMAPMMLLNLVYTIIDSFSDVSNPIIGYILENGFNKSNFEFSAAMGWVYFIFILIVIGLIFLLMRKSVEKATD